MHYNATSTEELATGWPAIAKAAGIPDAHIRKVKEIAKRDGWPIYFMGHTPVANPFDLVEHIRALAKARAARGRPPVDPVRALLAEGA